MTLALSIIAALIAALTISGLFGCAFGAFIDAGMHPRRGQGETQRSRQDGGEGLGFETTHNGGIKS